MVDDEGYHTKPGVSGAEKVSYDSPPISVGTICTRLGAAMP